MRYTAAELSLRGQRAVYARWAQTPDRAAATAPARQGFMARFERIVRDRAAAQGWTLTPLQLAEMAQAEMRSHMAGIRLGQSLTANRDKAKRPAKTTVCSWCHPKTAGKSHQFCQRHAAVMEAQVATVRARHADDPELLAYAARLAAAA